MNYPIWDLPASGLLIAFVAIVHVFVSHFAVGGGLFLVVTERKARRENDDALLDYVRRHSRFFILLTLVFGAVTGVGIWFTIGLVHPSATSALINAWVWGWAIEWAFFLTEIAAAIVYYYGWDRLTARQHLIVGWIYFGAAWASLAVINGILSFMLTPGEWLLTRGFMDGFFNPTYWPSLIIRTLGAVGLAGVYALFTASWLASAELKRKLASYATIGWILPMAIGLPLSLFWYFSAADRAGVPVAEIFGTRTAGAIELLRSIFATATTGHPVAQRALLAAVVSITVTIILAFTLLLLRRERFGRVLTVAIMAGAMISIGSSEWVREDLRKPFVIGSYMFTNGVRLPAPEGSPAAARNADDPHGIDQVAAAGVLVSSRWSTPLPPDVSQLTIDQEVRGGREVFRILCSSCHTTDGYLAVRPLVAGSSSSAIEGMLGRLAVAHDSAERVAAWSTPGIRLATWRNRRMPPFVGTADEKRALAVYLAKLGGGAVAPRAAAAAAPAGEEIFESTCAACHSSDSDWPIQPRVAGESEEELYEILGELPERNEMMPPFEGTEEERRALAKYLSALSGTTGGAR